MTLKRRAPFAATHAEKHLLNFVSLSEKYLHCAALSKSFKTDGGKWLTLHPALEPEQRPNPPCVRVASPLSVTRAGSSCYALDDEGDDATQLFFLCVCGVCVPRGGRTSCDHCYGLDRQRKGEGSDFKDDPPSIEGLVSAQMSRLFAKTLFGLIGGVSHNMLIGLNLYSIWN